MNDLHLLISLQQEVHFWRILGPEVPRLVIVIEGRMGEDDDRRALLHLRQIIPEPPQLLLADMEGARQRVIESAGDAHPLFRREAAGGPKVPEINGVQRNKVNPVLIPGIGGLAEMLLIGISHIEIPVMLSGDVFDLGFQGRK